MSCPPALIFCFSFYVISGIVTRETSLPAQNEPASEIGSKNVEFLSELVITYNWMIAI